jgi:hypothetical protein
MTSFLMYGKCSERDRERERGRVRESERLRGGGREREGARGGGCNV